MITIKYTDPTADQNAEQVETYYRNVKPGDDAVVRCTQGNLLRFVLDKIAEGSPKRGRVYLEQGESYGGKSYWAKNGKSCFQPMGQSHLVVPTPEVLKWIEDRVAEGKNKMPDRFGVSVLRFEVSEVNVVPPGLRSAGVEHEGWAFRPKRPLA